MSLKSLQNKLRPQNLPQNVINRTTIKWPQKHHRPPFFSVVLKWYSKIGPLATGQLSFIWIPNKSSIQVITVSEFVYLEATYILWCWWRDGFGSSHRFFCNTVKKIQHFWFFICQLHKQWNSVKSWSKTNLTEFVLLFIWLEK